MPLCSPERNILLEKPLNSVANDWEGVVDLSMEGYTCDGRHGGRVLLICDVFYEEIDGDLVLGMEASCKLKKPRQEPMQRVGAVGNMEVHRRAGNQKRGLEQL
jgi:hypothetical protein